MRSYRHRNHHSTLGLRPRAHRALGIATIAPFVVDAMTAFNFAVFAAV
jgi:hypothetical protein